MDIVTLDLNFQGVPETVAAYLVKTDHGALLIETGPASTLPHLLTQIRKHDVEVEDIRHVLVTHIHLDHAGAAGWWTKQGAQVYVHHVGAPHLIDPGRLLISAERIYGDRMDQLWGKTEPAVADQVTALADGDILKLCGLKIEALDTPGHARHHLVFRIGDIAFTGDAAGLHLPGLKLVDLPAPPPEFDREEWRETIDRLDSHSFQTIYPTHFGEVKDPASQWAELKEVMEDCVYFVASRQAAGATRDEIVQEYRARQAERARKNGLGESQIRKFSTANPLEMSVDGILRYLKRRNVQVQSH